MERARWWAARACVDVVVVVVVSMLGCVCGRFVSVLWDFELFWCRRAPELGSAFYTTKNHLWGVLVSGWMADDDMTLTC